MNSFNEAYTKATKSLSDSYDSACTEMQKCKEAVYSTAFGKKFTVLKHSESGQKACEVSKSLSPYVAAAFEVVPVGHYLLLKKIYAQKTAQAKQELAHTINELKKDPQNIVLKSKVEDLKHHMSTFKVPKNFTGFVNTGLMPHLGLQVVSVGLAVSVNEAVKKHLLGRASEKTMTVQDMFICATAGGIVGGFAANSIEKGLQYQTAEKGFFKTVIDSVKTKGVRKYVTQGMGATVPREIVFNLALSSGVPLAMTYVNQLAKKGFGEDKKVPEFLVTISVALAAGFLTSPLETCRAVQHNMKNADMSVAQAARKIASEGNWKAFFSGSAWRNTRFVWYLTAYPFFKSQFNKAMDA